METNCRCRVWTMVLFDNVKTMACASWSPRQRQTMDWNSLQLAAQTMSQRSLLEVWRQSTSGQNMVSISFQVKSVLARISLLFAEHWQNLDEMKSCMNLFTVPNYPTCWFSLCSAAYGVCWYTLLYINSGLLCFFLPVWDHPLRTRLQFLYEELVCKTR